MIAQRIGTAGPTTAQLAVASLALVSTLALCPCALADEAVIGLVPFRAAAPLTFPIEPTAAGTASDPRVVGSVVAASAPLRSSFAPSGFWRTHLMPRLAHRFEELRDAQSSDILGLQGVDEQFHRHLIDRVQSGTEKAAERAVTDWLLEETQLEAQLDAWIERKFEPWVDSLSNGSGADVASASPSAVDGGAATRTVRSRWRPGVSVGLSHSLPKAKLTWQTGADSAFRLNVRTYGTAEIEWVRHRGSEHKLYAGWNGVTDDVHLQYRLGF